MFESDQERLQKHFADMERAAPSERFRAPPPQTDAEEAERKAEMQMREDALHTSARRLIDELEILRIKNNTLPR